jgi:NAD(P) transhydrogenase subunit alpha
MSTEQITSQADKLAGGAQHLAAEAGKLAEEAGRLGDAVGVLAMESQKAAGIDPLVFGLTVFVLACFVGYYVVWKVTPALHSPLMSVTNAISSVIIVGALIAAGPAEMDFSKVMGFVAVALASINIFGGFIVSQRMLRMYRKKK